MAAKNPKKTTPEKSPSVRALTIAMAGSGGTGAITAGNILLETCARAGLFGILFRSVGPQIRGGEAAAFVRLGAQPVVCNDGKVDVLVAMDWQNTDRFAAEMKLGKGCLVIGDASAEVPEFAAKSGAEIVTLAMRETAEEIEGGRINMVALGVVAAKLGLPVEALKQEAAKRIAKKGEAAVRSSEDSIEAGARLAAGAGSTFELANVEPPSTDRWVISGNEACGLGAVRGGVRFAAAYPITPATEILEWLAPALTRVGGRLVQAEDELASINMIIGASYGGTPSITATSGPGLALMTEALGLATAAEVPIVVVDVMRGGPSTGIPTKSEQSDLNIALYGLHGDAPHIVVAPLSFSDCVFTTQWSVYLAEAMQTAAIVLSDQFLGQTRAVIEKPANVSFMTGRRRAESSDAVYKRYAVTADGVSPMAVPGIAGCQYTADGLEHAESGIPSSAAEAHHTQLAKRLRKIEGFDYGEHWAERRGDGDVAIITWGSISGAANEAMDAAEAEGFSTRLIAMRLLSPARPDDMARALEGVSGALVVEQTHSAQFLGYLRSHYDLPDDVRSLSRPGPLAITPADILDELRSMT